MTSKELRRRLRRAGFSTRAIDAVWPEWWSAEAEHSASASNELRYTLARRLGLSPRSLLGGEPVFVWHDHAKFKSLGTESDQELAVLSSFGTAVGRSLINALQGRPDVSFQNAFSLREAMLDSSPLVTITELLSACWSIGVPVIYLTVFPLGKKRMHAMTVQVDNRYAILLGRDSPFPAQVAYWLAHELAHAMLGHLAQNTALLELEEPLLTSSVDEEEDAADRYALTLLTGEEAPVVVADKESFSATQLADAALTRGRELRIDPGVLALCLGYSTGRWKQVMGALKILPPGERDVRGLVNSVARQQLDWSDLPQATRDYLETILGHESAP